MSGVGFPVAVVTAVVEQGVTNNRVAKLKRVRAPHLRDGTVSTTAIGVSLYLDELAAIDAIVQRVRDLGVPNMTRSRLIRIAVRRLDVDRLIASIKELH